jgi:hypothetical protein
MITLFVINSKIDHKKQEVINKNDTSDQWEWKTSRFHFYVKFIEKTDKKIVMIVSNESGKEVLRAFLNTDSPIPGYKWFGRWDETYSENWGYIRLNEKTENGKTKFFGEQSNGWYGDEFIHPTTIE